MIANKLKTFYSPVINSDLVTLSEDESVHCLRVLRLKKNDLINLTDGKGILCEAILLDENIKGCCVKIINKTFINHPLYIHIALAPTKNISRFEWFFEKSTEIGISQITPLICEHAERKTINLQRLNKIIISALKQSQNTFLPILSPPTKFPDFIQYYSPSAHETASLSSLLFIAVCDFDIKLPTLKDTYQKGKNCIILIGPEGDFSNAEVKLAIDNGYTGINLSKNRLRTETAALIACSSINLLNQ